MSEKNENENLETEEEKGRGPAKIREETKAEEKEEIIKERIYTVPLSRAWITPVTKRAPRAVRILKAFIRKHMKVEEDSIIISNEVNERIWSRGIEKPPRKIRIKAEKDKDGIVTVSLAETEGD